MSRYVKRHRRGLLGIAAPAVALLFLVAFGLSIFPNHVVYGLPGDSCIPQSDVSACNACNGESCTLFEASPSPVYECANFPDGPNGLPNFDPSITVNPCPIVPSSDSDPDDPGCWTACELFGDEGFVCLPNNNYCEDISGGTTASSCRIATCTDTPGFDPQNPSGCDFDYISSEDNPDCINCSDAEEAEFDNCGNGVCEVAGGEDCSTCAIDCLVPGFEYTCPYTDTVEACIDPQVVLPGPPYNGGGEAIEDGDLCTDSACGENFALENSPKSCSQDDLDFCCPAGCEAPPEALNCDEADSQGLLPRTECDADCYIPQACVIPVPTPTPPVPTNLLEGSGALPCSLQHGVKVNTSQGLLSLMSLGLGLGALGYLRRRKA